MVYDGSERQRASTTQTRTKLVSPQDSLNIITPVTCSPVFSPFSCVERKKKKKIYDINQVEIRRCLWF